MQKQPKKTVSVALPLDLYAQLKLRAEEDCRTVPGCIRQILKLHFQALNQNKTPD